MKDRDKEKHLSIKVGIFSFNLPSGGLPRVFVKEFQGLSSRGYNCFAFACKRSYPEYYAQIINGINLSLLNNTTETVKGSSQTWKVLKCFHEITKYLKLEKPDIILCHEIKSTFLLIPLILIKKQKTITFLHDNPFLFETLTTDPYYHLPKIIKLMLRRLIIMTMRISNSIVCTSKGIFESIKSIDLPNVVTIQYGIDYNYKEMESTHAKDLLLTVSSWSKFRQPDRYLELIPISDLNVNLVMAGHWSDSKLKELFIQKVKDKGLSSKVIIIDDVSEEKLTELYTRAIAFIRFGFSERGTGQGVYEALGYGVPVIINESLGATEIIQNGKHGLILPLEDETFVRKQILVLLHNSDRLKMMSKECLKLAEENSWDNYNKNLSNLLLDTFLEGRDPLEPY